VDALHPLAQALGFSGAHLAAYEDPCDLDLGTILLLVKVETALLQLGLHQISDGSCSSGLIRNHQHAEVVHI